MTAVGVRFVVLLTEVGLMGCWGSGPGWGRAGGVGSREGLAGGVRWDLSWPPWTV